jgi:putative membrane protein
MAMNRRLVLLGVSAVTPLLGPAAIRPAAAQNSTATGAGTSGSTGGTLGLLGYRAATLQLGALSRQTSEVALQRAQNLRVKQFAGFENAEQITMAQVLTSEESPQPPALTPENAAILQQVQQTQAGPAFDRQYVASQLQVHQALYRAQESFLQGAGTVSADPVHIAMLARTMIQEHMRLLEDIKNALNA